jgi:hypothetical protein
MIATHHDDSLFHIKQRMRDVGDDGNRKFKNGNRPF